MLFVASPLLIAHRGASAEAPENTLAAFRRALALKVDGLELDVQTTRDGVAVVFHDATLRRLTGEPGRVVAQTWRALQKLRVNRTEPIPRLVDVLRLTRSRTVVQIELKRGVVVAPVIRAIRTARAAKWVILASFEPRLVREAARLAPTIPRMLIAEGGGTAGQLLRRMVAAGAAGLSLNYRTVRNRGFVKTIQAGGASLWCWTVNRPADMRRLAGWGVNGLLSDNPALLKRGV